MKFMLPVAAVMSMAAAPAMAAPQVTRQAPAVEQNSELAGGGFVVALIALAAVIAGVVIVANGDDSPNSP